MEDKDLEYDEYGGIVGDDGVLTASPAQSARTSGRSGYNILERLLLRRIRKVNYLLDPQGRYLCRADRLPSVLRLGITNRCTARCFYCPRESIHAGGSGYMDFGLYRKLIDHASDHGIKDVGFALWGEPLLHPRILEMISYAHGKGLRARISTNAIALNNELSDRLLAYPLKSVEISMDGSTRDEYRIGKGVDQYELAKSNVLYLLKQAKNTGYSAVFNIHFVDAGNVSFMNKLRFVRYWKKQLKGLRSETSFCYEPHNWAGTRSDVIHRMNPLDRLLMRFELKKPCLYIKGLAINWNGDAIVCANNPLPGAKLGNVNTDALESLYQGQRRNEFLAAHENGTFDIDGCRECTVNSIYPLLYVKKKVLNSIIAVFI